jgi:hypothetical protein
MGGQLVPPMPRKPGARGNHHPGHRITAVGIGIAFRRVSRLGAAPLAGMTSNAAAILGRVESRLYTSPFRTAQTAACVRSFTASFRNTF